MHVIGTHVLKSGQTAIAHTAANLLVAVVRQLATVEKSDGLPSGSCEATEISSRQAKP